MATKSITAFFTKYGVPITGLSPTIVIRELHPSIPTNSTIVINGISISEVGGGWYRYDFTSYDINKNYLFVIDGGNSLQGGERYQSGGNENMKEEITNNLLEEQSLLHVNTGTLGLAINQTNTNVQQLVLDSIAIQSLLNLLLKYEKNRTKIDKVAKTLTVYQDDGITVLKVFELKDSTGALSITEVVERNPL